MMWRALEISGFALGALGLHLAALLHFSAPGSESAGSGGQAVVAIAPASGTLIEAVQRWNAPPEVETAAAPRSPPELPQNNAGDLAMVQPMDLPPAAPQMPVLAPPPARAAAPVLDTRSYTPPPPPQPDPVPEPKAKPKPKPKPARAVKAQRAAGKGGGVMAGRKKARNVATMSKGQQAKQVAVWGARIRSRIERNKRFPRGARGGGTVRLRIRVDNAGRLAGAQVIGSAGQSALDKAALQAVARAGRFPAAPKGVARKTYSFTLKMRFGR